MSQLHIGIPQFISVRPLIYGLMRNSDPSVNVTYGNPSTLAEGLSRGAFDAALIPSIEYLRGAGHFFVEGVGLIARPAAGSLILQTRKPLSEIERIAVGEFSRSPVAVARIVLAEHHGITPDMLVEKNLSGNWEENYDAVLCGGDFAMQQMANGTVSGVETHNISDMWYELTESPLILGLWAYRDRAHLGQLTKHLLTSRNLGIQNLSRLADGISQSTQFGSEFLYDYLSRCWTYGLGDAELEGLHMLEEYALRYDLLRVARLEKATAS